MLRLPIPFVSAFAAFATRREFALWLLGGTFRDSGPCEHRSFRDFVDCTDTEWRRPRRRPGP